MHRRSATSVGLPVAAALVRTRCQGHLGTVVHRVRDRVGMVMVKAALPPLVAFALAIGLVIGVYAGFSDSLDNGAPSSPQPVIPPDLRVTFHIDDNTLLGQGFNAMNADHAADCSFPPGSHPIAARDFKDNLFACKNHLMTAVHAAGDYGLIAMQANQLADMSNGPATIDWDVSTLKTSGRDWWAISVAAQGEELQAPIHPGFGVDLVDAPRDAFGIHLDNATCSSNPNCGPTGATIFRAWQARGGSGGFLDGCGPNLEENLPGGVESAAIRTHFRLVLSPTHATLSLPDNPDPATGKTGAMLCDGPVNLNFTHGVVSWAHHSYDVEKDTGVPNTWHWSNFAITPSIPYTVINANERLLQDVSGGGTFTLPQPAPAGAFATWMMDAGDPATEQVSFDGGKTWQQATQQPGTAGQAGGDHARQLRVPIPQGATSFAVRGAGDYARDAAVIAYSTPST
jgi:hypothetical protein